MMIGRQPVLSCDNLTAQAHYSDALKAVVRYLLRFSEARVDRVLPTTEFVMEFYRRWKLHTEEGKLYKDIEDDMAARCS